MFIEKQSGKSFLAAMAACVALMLPAAAAVMTNYVDNGMSDYIGHDGSSPELALKSLQSAIDATPSGGVVIVAPGDYGEDQGLAQKSVDIDAEAGSARGSARIRVPQGKNLLIKSSGGASVTSIVGAHDPGTENGLGPNAVRCVDVEMDSSCSKQVIFEGFTFRDGATAEDLSQKGIAGAVYSSNTFANPRSGSFAYGTYLVDCVISNCIGASTGALTIGCTLVRCRIQDNALFKPSVGNLVVCAGERFVNCLITRNRTIDPASGTNTTTSTYWGVNSYFLNCSFVDNAAYFWCQAPCHFRNSIDAMSRKNSSDGSSTGNNGTRLNDFSDSTANRYMIAPSLGDYRLRTGCEAATGGDASYFSDTTFYKPPTVYAIDIYRDIDGNVIPSEGAIAAGCSQETASPAAGALVGADACVEFSGRDWKQFSAPWVWPAEYPAVYTVSVRSDVESRLFSYLLDSEIVYPSDYKNDRLVLRPSPDADTTVGYTLATPGNAACRLLYLDAETAEDDASQDGSAEHPYRTFARAVADIGHSQKAVFVAAPGDYDDGEGTVSINGIAVRGRFHLDQRHVRLVSVAGPSETAIVGAADPDTLESSESGLGPNAVGIAALRHADGAIQGFTLKNGYSGTDTYTKSGAVYSYDADRLVISDSVVTGCRGLDSVIGPARYVRCRLTGNTGMNGFFANKVSLVSSIVDDTEIESASGIYFPSYTTYEPFAFGLTMVADSVHSVFFNNSNGRFCNSLFAGGGKVESRALTETFAGTVLSGFDSELWTEGVTYADNPMLMSEIGVEDDFRVFTGSAAVGAATAEIDGLAGALRQYANLDYTGKVRVSRVAGAYDDVCAEGVYVQGGAGVAVVAGGKVGYNPPGEDGELTLGFTAGSSRPLAGYIIDGKTNLIVSATDLIKVPSVSGEGHYAVPVYSDAWYVDDVNGSDSTGLGYNPACAFKTIPAALTNAALVAGDRVLVQPGTYDEGTMDCEGGMIGRRASVPEHITLESVAGAAMTFIKGEASDIVDVPASGSSENNAGLGSNAVACVYLPVNSVLRGFTLTNGHTRACNDVGKTVHGGGDYTGGGVYGKGRVENCVITGCKAFRGGGGCESTFVNCLIERNGSVYHGAGTSDAYQYGCLFRDNFSADGSGAAHGPFWWEALENCTVLDSAGGPRKASGIFRNDLILGPVRICGEPDLMAASNFVRCAVVSGVGGYQDEVNIFKNTIPAGDGNILTNSSCLAVDEDGRPVIGSSLAVDAGDAALNSAYIGETDLGGTRRVYNGAIDIGALEADWREAYARDLGRRSAVEVTEASAGVTETEARTVRLVDGETLGALVTPEAGRSSEFEVHLAVSGAGTLTVLRDGVTVAEIGEGSETLVFEDVSGPFALEFVFEGEGFAELLGIRSVNGTFILLR